MLLDDLRRVYDLELILYYWCLGKSNNRIIDYRRLKNLISATDSSDTKPFFDLQPPSRDQSTNALDWYNPTTVTSHCYVPCLSEHIRFTLHMADHLSLPTDNCLEIFEQLLEFYAHYSAKSWNLTHILSKNHFNAIRCFSIIVIEKHRRSVKYSNTVKRRAISFNRTHISVHGLYLSITRPSTLIGQIILNVCVKNTNSLRSLQHDESVRRQCFERLRNKNIECFPSFLVNDEPVNADVTKSWNSWCKVQLSYRQ